MPSLKIRLENCSLISWRLLCNADMALGAPHIVMQSRISVVRSDRIMAGRAIFMGLWPMALITISSESAVIRL